MTIATSTPAATIYYTTNGATPTTSSPVYSGPVSVSATETLQAIAVATGNSSSPVGSAVYTITPPPATPSFSPAAGTYTATQTVTIGSATPSATLYYTTNGTTPTTSSPVYSGPITVSATETLSAIAIATGNSSSPVGSAVYTITPPSATPSFSPAAGNLYGNPDRDHRLVNAVGHHLLHHQRDHTQHQLAGLLRPDLGLRHRDPSGHRRSHRQLLEPGRLGGLHHHPARGHPEPQFLRRSLPGSYYRCQRAKWHGLRAGDTAERIRLHRFIQLLRVARRSIVQLLARERDPSRPSGFDNTHRSHLDDNGGPSSQLRSIVSRRLAGGCVVLPWLEKTAWAASVVGTDRRRNRPGTL